MLVPAHGTSLYKAIDDSSPQLPIANSLKWLVASFFCTAFGPGFQCIPVLAFVQPFFLLRFCAEARGRLPHLFAALVAQALGVMVAYAGIFNNPTWT